MTKAETTMPTSNARSTSRMNRVFGMFALTLAISTLSLLRSPVQSFGATFHVDADGNVGLQHQTLEYSDVQVSAASDDGNHNSATATVDVSDNPLAVPPASAFDGDELGSETDASAATGAAVGAATTIQVPRGMDIPRTNASSACMIWMDDSPRLVEWIAYHYYTFSLRTLILFRDPKSTQDLGSVVRRWKGLMDIRIWYSQTQFFTYTKDLEEIKNISRTLPEIEDPEDRRDESHRIHKINQREFYRSCSIYLQRRRHDWTIFIDPDEHIVLNSQLVPNASEKMLQPGSILDTLKWVQRHNITNGNSQFETPCITLARTPYGAIESPDDHVHRGVPDFLDPYRFQTLRFRHTEGRKLIGKAIADVSRLRFEESEISAHRLLMDQCPHPWGDNMDIFRINHYIGSYDAFQRIGDRRGTVAARKQKWRKLGSAALDNPGKPAGDEARNWIRGFVNAFGKEDTETLLLGAGYPYDASVTMKRAVPPCGALCVESYDPEQSMLHAIDQKLASESRR